MKLIFLGTSGFAVPALRAVAGSAAAVISRPDRPAGRGRTLKKPPAALEAEKLGLKLLQPEKLSEIKEEIVRMEPSVMVSASYGAWLPEWFLNLAPLGVVNIHPSLLPRHRGAAPIVRAILEGDRNTGVSFMVTDSGWDTGNLLKVYRHPVKAFITAGQLEEELALLAASKLSEVLEAYGNGDLTPVPQLGEESYAGKITPDESVINWKSSAEEVLRTVLAFNPVPGARTFFRKGILKIHQGTITSGNGVPGRVISLNPLTVCCGRGSLVLLEIQPQGKRRMQAEDFIRGYRIEPGDSLGEE